jgi:hypothetical protein
MTVLGETTTARLSAADTVPVYRGKERWQEWEKTG